MFLAGCSDRSGPGLPISPLTGADVRRLGAVADGTSPDTRVIQAAINRVAAGGGGVVDFPAGRYLVGTLFLRTGVTLHLQKGAVLLGSTNYYDYYNLSAVESADLPGSNYPQDEARFGAIIVALDQHTVGVTGEGEIDGRGTTTALNIHALQESKKLPGDPKNRPDESLRPALLNFVRCQNVTVTGVTLRDSACWCEVYCDCDTVDVSHVTVRSKAYWNNDGIDICGCKNVRITDFDADVSDDGICLKSNSAAVEHVTISRCKISSWANGIKLGTVSCVGFDDIKIDHVEITEAGHSGVAIESVDGGDCRDISVSDVKMTKVTNGLFVKLGDRHRRGGADGESFDPLMTKIMTKLPKLRPVGAFGHVGDIRFENITGSIRGDDPCVPPTKAEPYPPNPRRFDHNCFPAVVVSGLPGHPVRDVRLEHVNFKTPGGGDPAVADASIEYLSAVLEYANTYPEYSMHGELPAVGWFCRHVDGLRLEYVNVAAVVEDYRPVYVFDDVTDLRADHFSAAGTGPEPLVAIQNVDRATLTDATADSSPTPVVRRLPDCRQVIVKGLTVRQH